MASAGNNRFQLGTSPPDCRDRAFLWSRVACPRMACFGACRARRSRGRRQHSRQLARKKRRSADLGGQLSHHRRDLSPRYQEGLARELQGGCNTDLLRTLSRETAGFFARDYSFPGMQWCSDVGKRTYRHPLCGGRVLRFEGCLAPLSRAIRTRARLRTLPGTENVVMLKIAAE